MKNYMASISAMQKSIARAANEDAPRSSADIRVLYTPSGYIDAGRQVMTNSSTSNPPLSDKAGHTTDQGSK